MFMSSFYCSSSICELLGLYGIECKEGRIMASREIDAKFRRDGLGKLRQGSTKPMVTVTIKLISVIGLTSDVK